MIANYDELSDLVAAYATDALEASERLRVEAALNSDQQLRDELDGHYAVLATLAAAVDLNPSTPSHLVWEKISNEIDGAAEVSPKLASIHDIRAQRRATRLTAAISIAAIGLAAVLAVSVMGLQQERSADPVDVAIQELLEDPASTLATLAAANDTASEARIVLGTNGVGYLYADSLPTLDATRTYQLWAIVGDQVISAGVLGPDPDDSPFQVVGDIAGFAITDEVAGGVPVSEGETVAVWLRNG